jgi:spore photoproduct lyase
MAPNAMLETPPTAAPDGLISLGRIPAAPPAPRLWMPRRVVLTPAALAEPWGRQIRDRVTALGLPVEELTANRLTGLKGDDARDTYRRAKTTLAVVTAPPSQFKLQPIPPSADWQFHLAEGCPAHCQYCYLAGSLSGPPVIRAYANLPAILENLTRYAGTPDAPHSFEASCYTDPLGIEHLTGSLSETIRFFGERGHEGMHLRWVSKFDAVEPLLSLPHHNRTRCRISLNADPASRRFEGGTAPIAARLAALRRLALPTSQGGGGYPVGVVLAPIMPLPDWEQHYSALLDDIATSLDFPCDLTFELITHRFTPGSKETLLSWYPATQLDLDESARERKFTKFGGAKYVYPRPTMRDLKRWFEQEITHRFPAAPVLYFT